MAYDKPTSFVFLDKRRVKNNGKYPIKLVVDYAGERKTYKTKEELTEEDWEKIQSGAKIKLDELKKAKASLSYYIGDKFNNALKEIEKTDKPFSFQLFERYYFGEKQSNKVTFSVFDAIDRKINLLEKAGRIGTAGSCRNLKTSLSSFVDKLNFKDITPEFLLSYEQHMLKNQKSITTVGIYMRELRAIVNEAINDPEHSVIIDYPFSRNKFDKKYKIPKGRNPKKALSPEEIEKIKTYTAVSDSERRAVDFWLFSYYCNGINVADIARLTYESIDGKFITFRRKKTERTQRDAKYIRAFINEPMKNIIKRWGNKQQNSSDYIFPILEQGITPAREHQLVTQFSSWLNGYMWSVSKKLELSLNVSMIHARHSFATTLKRNGANNEFIGDSLGHSLVSTTENYLGSFNDDTIEEKAKLL